MTVQVLTQRPAIVLRWRVLCAEHIHQRVDQEGEDGRDFFFSL